jgi:cytochrome c oxidase assembly protein subunit 15
VLEPGRGDHFLLFYPVEKWFRDVGTFVEHTHRLFGTLVGLLAIAQLASTFVTRRPVRLRWMSFAALAAGCVQGTLGGLRVLEASPELAFVHGVCAQAVFAVLAVNWVVNRPAWAAATRTRLDAAPALVLLGWGAALAVYAEIALGAWLRHSGSSLALVLHAAFVLGVVAFVLAFARGLRAAAAGSPDERQPLARAARNLVGLLGAQVALGILALVSVLVFSGGFEGAVSTGEIVFATLHVLVGALLLVQSVAGALWCGRLLSSAPAGARPDRDGAARPRARGLEGAA